MSEACSKREEEKREVYQGVLKSNDALIFYMEKNKRI